jgi:hypothetical protein
MFEGDPDAKKKARAIVRRLTDYSGNRTHSLHLHSDECQRVGIKVEDLEANSDFQDLVLTVHHCYMHALTNGPAFKIIENQNGAAWVKAQQPVARQL